MDTLPAEILNLIYLQYYSNCVLKEFTHTVNKFLYSVKLFDGRKQILYFEKDIREENILGGNSRKYVFYDSVYKRCYTVKYNNIFQGYEQVPNKSFKDIVSNKSYL